MSEPRSFRVVIFTSASPENVVRFASRLHQEVPEAVVCGVLHESRRPKTLCKRAQTFVRNLREWQFIKYAAARVVHSVRNLFVELGSRALCFLHACPPWPGGHKHVSMPDLARLCQQNGGELFVTADIHSPQALSFVQQLHPDLGIIYGTRILKPELFTIPRQGSINIHKRKVPDYRGGGPVGLWELLDGLSEIGVTVHRVEAKLDAGAVINATAIPIEEFDSLSSLALKADVVGNDLLIRSTADFARGTVRETPQTGTGRIFKNPKPQQLAAYERELERRRARYTAPEAYPGWKLLLRTLLLAPYAAPRNWYRRWRGEFPVIILFHHLVTDRQHPMGIPTDLFLNQVEFLRKHYQVVGLEEGIELLRTRRVKAPTVVLTFDDGYRSNFVNLRAIVEATGIPVTLFVCTQRIADQREFDHDASQGLHEFLPLTPEQVKYLSTRGWEIGAHTRTHFDCGATDLAMLRDEIVGSKADLERMLGHAVRFFSFPFGRRENISAAAEDLARSNYSYVFSAEGGANFVENERDCFLVRAFHPSSLWQLELTCQSMLEFWVKGAPPFLREGRHARSLTTDPSMGGI